MWTINNRYILHEQLGAGGMGTIYRATDRLTGEIVALKRVRMIPTPIDARSSHEERYRLALAREFQTLASLRHPHIISVLDYGFDSKRLPFFTMQLLDNARALYDASSGLTLGGKVRLMVQILEALAYLHRRGVVHCDLKPANVLVDEYEQVKVLDFGLAHTADQRRRGGGTVAYAAPEMLQGQAPTPAADLYAVGVMLYEWLTGGHPFASSSSAQLLEDILYREPDFTRITKLDDTFISSKPTIPPLVDDGPTRPPVLADTPTVPFLATPPDSHSAPSDAPPDAVSDASSALITLLSRLLAKDPHLRPTARAAIHALCSATEQPVPVVSHAVQQSYLEAATFVGRQTELTQLTTALDLLLIAADSHSPPYVGGGASHAQATRPTGEVSAWLIGGESGVGKSRLMDELRSRALVRGARVVRGQSIETGGLPYQLWRDVLPHLILASDPNNLQAAILKTVVPHIDQLLGRDIPPAPELTGKAGRNRLMHTIAALLKRQPGPLVLLLEDLQWAHEGLLVLRYLLDHPLPVMIVGTFRADERPDLPDELPQMHHIPLDRLTETEIADLSHSMLGEAGQSPDVLALLARETEGNAYFLVEVVRALAEEAGSLSAISEHRLPASVLAGGIHTVLQRRLGRLPEAFYPMLQLAAVAGRELDFHMLSHIQPIDDNFLYICADSAVLVVNDGRWYFSHDKLRETLVADLAPSQRADLHRVVATTIEEVYGGQEEDYAEALLEHWSAAGDAAKEIHYSLPVARYLVTYSAEFDRAQAVLRRTLQLLDEHPEPAWRVEALELLGTCLEKISDYPAATRYAKQSRRLAEKIGDQRAVSRALRTLGWLAHRQGDYATAEEFMQQSFAVCRRLDDQPGIAAALHYMGSIAERQGRYDEAENYYTLALEIRREHESLLQVGTSLSSLGMIAYARGDYQAAADYVEQDLEIKRQLGDVAGMGTCLNNLGGIVYSLGDYDQALEYLEQSLAIREQTGQPFGIASALNNLGEIAIVKGDYDLALDYHRRALALRQDINDRQGQATSWHNLMGVYLKLGQMGDAHDAIHEALKLAQGLASDQMYLWQLMGAAEVWTAVGKHQRAAHWVGLALDHAAADQLVRDKAELLQPSLIAALGEDGYQAVLEAGKGDDLAATIDGLVDELEQGREPDI